MKRALLAGLLGLVLITALSALPGLNLHYVGSMHGNADYQVAALHNATQELRFYKLFPSGNGFGIESYYMTLACGFSAPEYIYNYQHPVDFLQDGGFPSLVLSQNYGGKVYFLQKNDLNLFMTVIDENLQTTTYITNNPALNFEADPMFRRTFCFLGPDKMILSSQGSVYILNLQAAQCTFYWSFPNSDGFITFNRLDEERVVITSSVSWPDYANYLLNYQTLARTQITSIYDWPLRPLSEDFGDNTFICAQSYSLDWTHWVWTLLMRINANGYANLYHLAYGGSDGVGDYTPLHSFQYINVLEDNRFLAICTDYNQVPYNQRLGLWQIVGNGVAYDSSWPELQTLESPSRLYKLQDGYYLSYHNNTPAAEAARLIDMEAQAISLPDSNLITSPPTIVTTENNAFYALYSNLLVHVYTLVEPSATEPETQTPPAILALSAHPNPFRDQVSISLNAKEPGPLSVSVYDLRGRLVRTLEPSSINSGSSYLDWDGKDSHGVKASPGVYLIRAECSRQTATRKVLLLP